MLLTRPLRGSLGKLALLGLIGLGLAEPALADPDSPTERSPIEFRLHPVESTTSADVDIWKPADPQVLLETQAELAALRPLPQSIHQQRAPFGEAILTGVASLPVLGQFANREWLKGLVVLGTAAGLTTAIVLGNERNNAQLVRLGTLGLYPLAVFGTVDAIVTRNQRFEAPEGRPIPTSESRRD